ncbi:unnamed protein product [Candida verbasci]|uniref:Kinesin motor domain-containing protein n=1 Tax=Candida verbasci TaxID=1227364 RepID=A0A9W4TWR9_9ASCO|nr:unnamed protein product [Candida verbasci]
MNSNNIKVTVRVRPLLKREIESNNNAGSLISMPDSNTVILQNSKTDDKKEFQFDECIWSYNKQDSNFVDNYKYYSKVGPELLSHLFEGFNVCLLAYGQTSSGKTFTMMGNKHEPGIIPFLIKDILKQMEISVNEKINSELKFSYIEIYNEQVKDLLSDSDSKKCKIREHPITGQYVENVKEHMIENYQQFLKLLNKGNIQRSTATTSMNDKSSRSHAIITLTLKQTKFEKSDSDSIGDAEEEMISNIKLVDLAGSERLTKTKLYGQHDRVKEGSLINKSLTVLGRCINLLSSKSTNIIPYRDSILTYLLKENLSGNSKTCMIFCVSPMDYEETNMTLNYAKEVKKIKTQAKANKVKLSNVPLDWQNLQNKDQTMIDSLKNEINLLNEKLSNLQLLQSTPSNVTNIIEFLDKESQKVKFENKYLKNQLLKKNNLIMELNNHIDFIEAEYDQLCQESFEKEMDLLESSKHLLLKEVEFKNKSIIEDLTKFNLNSFT